MTNYNPVLKSNTILNSSKDIIPHAKYLVRDNYLSEYKIDLEKKKVRTNIDAQETLISGVNIKTINNESILGEGNINVEGGSVEGDVVLGFICDEPLVIPRIDCSWKIFTVDNTLIKTLTNHNISIEKGFIVEFNGTWKWLEEELKKNPTETEGSWGTILIEPLTPSENLNVTNIINNTTYYQALKAPKVGCIVQGDKIVKAGNNDKDTTRVSSSVSFLHRIYAGIINTSNPTGTDIKNILKSLLSNNRGQYIDNITISGNQRFCYAYPMELGSLTKAVDNNGINILSDFKEYDNIEVINNAGASIQYRAYVFNNLNAFTGAYIRFE